MSYEHIKQLVHNKAEEETISIICNLIAENNLKDLNKLKDQLGKGFVNHCITTIKERINDV